MNYMFIGNHNNNKKDKLISLINSLANNTELSTIFDIPSDVIEYLVQKDLDLSEYFYFGTLSSHNKQVVIFKNINNRKIIILMKKFSKTKQSKAGHRKLNVYPCFVTGDFKGYPSMRNIIPMKDLSDDLIGEELQNEIEFITKG